MSLKPDLSSFGESTVLDGYSQHADAPAPLPVRVNVFDACNVGVVLRAVLFVETVVAVGAMFGPGLFVEWLLRFSLLTGGVLPATLTWLIAACLLKGQLAHLGNLQQWLAGVFLGALAGLYGCGLLVMLGMLDPAPWWASAAAGALLSAVLVAGLFWRAKARTPAATAARLAELQSRIRPHFLFNTLNSAIALVRAEPAQAEAVLENLSELFRHALADPAESVTLDHEIALAKRYLAIEQIRFGDRLQVQWSLDPEANNAKLPPLLLQPLVENAVRHGVEPSAGGAQIKISTLRRGRMVVLKVTNTTPPAVVFVTAHAEYAVQAFEVEAVDYLTKPVRLERLQQALQKVERLAQAVQGLKPVIDEECLIIQDRGRTERVPLAEVLYLKAELKYVTVRTAGKSYILDGSLEERYAHQFMRIHRNALVAQRAVRALEKHFDPEEGDGWAVRLRGVDELLAVSRRQLSAVREAMAL